MQIQNHIHHLQHYHHPRNLLLVCLTETVTALEKLQDIVQETMSRDQQSTLRTLLQAGAMTERAQSGGERAQERETLLYRLGRTQGEQ